MPEASKNIAIGSLVALALGLILWVLLFLHPSFGDGNFRLHVRFSDIEKINIGTRVTYAGRAVGQVVQITQVPEEERTASVNPEAIYIYDLTLAIDSHIPLYDSDEITVGTSGLMGERFISVIPRRPKNHKATPIAFNEVIYSTKAPSMDDAFAQVGKVTESIASAARQFEQTMAQAHELIAKVAEGEGSLGKLLVSNDFYFKTSGLIGKLDVLMNDVNHYGVLFHLDKGWQRDRRRRIEELAALQNPKQFRSFINEEMYKITMAISRLSMALDKAQNEAADDTPLVANADFARTFNDLLGQVQDLQGTLKTYSIELADRQNEAACIAQEK